MEQGGQYTGWVKRVVILGLIQRNYKLQDRKEYTNPKDP